MKKAVVKNILLDKVHNSPVVELKIEEIKKNVYIWIGACEAWALAMAMENINTDRPLTHDLILKISGLFKANLVRIVITSVIAGTYYAKLVYEVVSDNESNTILELDCRPSDAIVLAVKSSVPIYVTSEIINSASIDDTSSDENEEEESKFKEFIQKFDVEELKKYMEDKNENP